VSWRRRKMIEEVFDWVKTVDLLRRLRHVDRERIAQMTEISLAAHILVRMSRPLATWAMEGPAGEGGAVNEIGPILVTGQCRARKESRSGRRYASKPNYFNSPLVSNHHNALNR
jgi:hypothetical protein